MDSLDGQPGTAPPGGEPPRLEDRILREVRGIGADLCRRARGRLGGRALGCLLTAPAAAWGLLWLAGGGTRPVPLPWAAWGFLAAAGLTAGAALALCDGLEGLVVRGPLLGGLGRLLEPPAAGQAAAPPGRQLRLFASPQALARTVGLLDLPPLLFLARCILGVDPSRLLRLAQGGAGREGLLAELERMARARAATSLCRARRAAWAALLASALLTALLLA